MVDDHYNIDAAIAPMAIVCQTSHIIVKELNKTIDSFYSLVACIVLSGAKKTNYKDRNFYGSLLNKKKKVVVGHNI